MAAATNIMATPSSLELMLKQIQQMEDLPGDVPPALPTRPVARARLPRSRRRLPFNSSQKGDQDTSSSFEETMFENKRAKCGDFVESDYQLESAERNGAGSPPFIVETINGSIEGCDCRKNGIDTAEKICNFDEAKDKALQWIRGIQRHLQGHQIYCYYHMLNKGVITLQAFVRAENARKHFTTKMTAISLIQKRVKGQRRGRILQEPDHAIICLQASIRGWLAWRHYNSIDKKEKQLTEDTGSMENLENKDLIRVPYSAILDLQRRVLKMEALLDKEKEENASLRLQIKQLERKKQQYEAKMSSMEKMWQDQLTSIQQSLEADKQNSSSKNTVGKLGLLFALPEDHDEYPNDLSPRTRSQVNGRLNSDQLIDHQNIMLDENAGILNHIEPGRMLPSSSNTEEELQKLKLKFKTWKKDFKTRLMVAKTTIKKLGNSETGRRGQKKWWGK